MSHETNTASALAKDMTSLSQQIRSLTQAIKSNRESLHSSSDAIKNAKQELVDAAEALLAVAQPPDPLKTAMVAMVQLTTLHLFREWKVFDAIHEAGTISYADLAEKLGADVALISRFAAILVATGVLADVGEDKITNTPSSLPFLSTSPMGAIIKMMQVNHWFQDHLLALHAMPAYFEHYGLKEPTGRHHTVHAFAAGDAELTVWEHLNRDPEKKKNMMAAMTAIVTRMPMTGSYNFSWVVAKGEASPDRVLVVDVGGGNGHALQAIGEVTPGLKLDKCAVEDLGPVVDEARATAKGELAKAKYVPVDFHSEQPIQGACIYYIRRCLHDYGDDVSVEILQHLRAAMADDSRVLIVEEVMQDPPLPFAVASDIYMATIGGKERTLKNFEAIASRSGLRIVKAHPSVGSDVAVIECAKI
ncbi:hypothetical protein N3K66_002808 [Trichothecium roseum]|uniref:Uncharacterized protein n=1 Tax=Trichothecium roseum TaxID=47278 RepID=A0ACC0VC57_9HYPO|nr:hypothetical protein N3K66_002808 [Trichothecium roseum]